MSVVHIHFRIIQIPLLKLSFFPDLKWRQFFECSFYFIRKVCDIKDSAGFQIISKQFLQDTAIHCRTRGHTMDTVIRGCKCIFRRRRWCCDEISVIRHQISQSTSVFLFSLLLPVPDQSVSRFSSIFSSRSHPYDIAPIEPFPRGSASFHAPAGPSKTNDNSFILLFSQISSMPENFL